MSMISPCPKCGSINVARQRSIEGETICCDCHYCVKSTDWDKVTDIQILLKNIRYQYGKNQLLNASYECAELQKVLLSKLSVCLKEAAE
jgi:hypothetical protein